MRECFVCFTPPSFLCSTINMCPNGIGSDIDEFANEDTKSLDTLDHTIVDGGISIDTCSSEMNWTAKRRLYRRLKKDTSLVGADPVMQGFVSTHSQTTVGRFHSIEVGIAELFELDTTTEAQLSSQLSTIKTKLDAIYAIDSTMAVGGLSTSEEDSLSLLRGGHLSVLDSTMAVNDTLTLSIATELANLTTTTHVLDSLRLLTADQLKTLNTAISTDSVYEANQKMANRIWLEILLNGQDGPDSQQAVYLTDIAAQCLYEGGEAVLQARAMLGTTNSYDDQAICAPPLPFIKSYPEKEGIAFTMYPNPTNGYLIIDLENELDSDGYAVIRNTLGQQLIIQSLDAGNKQVFLVLDDLSAGTFYLTIKSGSQSATKLFSNMK